MSHPASYNRILDQRVSTDYIDRLLPLGLSQATNCEPHELQRRGGFLAKRLKLRVSTERLHKLFAQVMRGETSPPAP